MNKTIPTQQTKRGIGKTLGAKASKPPKMVQVHVVVTRRYSGDVEKYLLAEVPDLRYALIYRKKLARVLVPTRLPKEWVIMPGTGMPSFLRKKKVA